jgi:hypothetical protein
MKGAPTTLAIPLTALAALAATAWPRPARADGEACVPAAEEGQRARRDGKLRRARELFLKCADDACAPVVRRDCAQWASDVDGILPSIVVDAKDGNHDVGDVSVKVDGEIVATKLDGKSIPVDPGPHTLSFGRPGRVPVVQDVIVKEGMRARVVQVRFVDDGTAPPAAGARPPPEAETPTREHTVVPWIVVAIGGATLVTGLVMFAVAPPLPSNCTANHNTCRRDPPTESDAELSADQDKASQHVDLTKAATIAVIGGAVITAGGLVWHFLEPSGPSSARVITPWLSPRAAGASAAFAF